MLAQQHLLFGPLIRLPKESFQLFLGHILPFIHLMKVLADVQKIMNSPKIFSIRDQKWRYLIGQSPKLEESFSFAHGTNLHLPSLALILLHKPLSNCNAVMIPSLLHPQCQLCNIAHRRKRQQQIVLWIVDTIKYKQFFFL